MQEERTQMEHNIHGGHKRSMRLQQIIIHRFQFLIDLSVLVAAFAFTYLLRFDFAVPHDEFRRALIQMGYVVLIQFAALLIVGVHTFIWRYIGLRELGTFLRAAIWSALPVLLLRLVLPLQFQEWRVPFSIIIVDTILAFGAVLGLRVLRRELYEHYEKSGTIHSSPTNKKRVLLIGAGRAGVITVREIQARSDMNIEVKGFIDDEPQKQGSVIQGVKVLGTSADLPRLVRELNIDHVVISIVEASRHEFRRLLNICEEIPIKVQVIPGLYEILEGKVKVSRIRDVQIEDVLGREPFHLDEVVLTDFITGKTVMVTGAGGSIGSELSRQVARFKPASLLVVERAEFALFQIERELRETWPELSVEVVVADVGNEDRMRAVFSRYHTDVVLHAAAHKHVPMMEFNVGEAITNNVMATQTLGRLAGEFGVQRFVLISTDKAVRPTSVMGASKRVAELVIQELEHQFQTRYLAVRFGNVIGSAGSVIPIFREQIQKGGPVTVTHPDVVRYFMTIPEAAQLVLQAGAIGKGGEIFILDMGAPVRILDLAKDIIALSGLKPFEEMEIVFTGLRPGEKLFEELSTSEEGVAQTAHPKIFIGQIPPYPQGSVAVATERLDNLARSGRDGELRRFLNELLPEARLSEATPTEPELLIEGLKQPFMDRNGTPHVETALKVAL
jgi:FlaA1/EpsC-like NDP-sugar epimerase